MRRNFAEVLKNGKIDYKNEYFKLYHMLYDNADSTGYENRSLYALFDNNFSKFYFHGTCLSLKEFDEQNGFTFPPPDEKVSIEDLISLMEYLYNMVTGFNSSETIPYSRINDQFYYLHIHNVAEAIGYEQSQMDGFCIFVEKNSAATAVSESPLIPKEISYKVISYNHYSMKENLEAKKNIILQLASLLEGKQIILRKVNSSLESDLFYLFNNLNLRHNNCDSTAKGKYKPAVEKMNKKELEEWYDETYQMCLLAFMEIEQAERKQKFDALKAQIESK